MYMAPPNPRLTHTHVKPPPPPPLPHTHTVLGSRDLHQDRDQCHWRRHHTHCQGPQAPRRPWGQGRAPLHARGPRRQQDQGRAPRPQARAGGQIQHLLLLSAPGRARGATVLHASTPVGAGRGNKVVINATQVFWPRVPLKEGGPRARKISVKVRAKIAKTATGPLLFNATAIDLATGSTITAVPTPLTVKGVRVGAQGPSQGRCMWLTSTKPFHFHKPTGDAQVRAWALVR